MKIPQSNDHKTKAVAVRKLHRCLEIAAFFYTSRMRTCKFSDFMTRYGVCRRTISRDIEHLGAAGLVLETYSREGEMWVRRFTPRKNNS